MKKIMFNDKYGLTQAVLNRRKTQTRRIVKDVDLIQYLNELEEDGALKGIRGKMAAAYDALYQVDEIVAIAQAYKNCKRYVCLQESAGFNNKMFVKADLMPHHIRITNVRIERLQDIREEDCIAEGIVHEIRRLNNGDEIVAYKFENEGYSFVFLKAREAYAALIGKISGKGTWESNPYVFVYDFELVD